MGFTWWVSDYLAHSKVLLLSQIFWVLAAIILHELAHGWMAIRCGDRTPVELGHMTWNPVVHMGTMGLVLFAIAGITFGAMPVNPRRFRGRYDDAKVALAGPAMNLILAAAAVVLFGVWDRYTANADVTETLNGNVRLFLFRGIQLNLMLGFFNLLPVAPLDGSTILARFSRTYRDTFTGPQAQQFSMMLFLLVFIYAGDHVAEFASNMTRTLVSAVSS